MKSSKSFVNTLPEGGHCLFSKSTAFSLFIRYNHVMFQEPMPLARLRSKGAIAMNINEPIVSEKECLFCEIDNALAHAFLRDAVNAVKMAGVEHPRDLQASVIKSMLIFHYHRASCEGCNEVSSTGHDQGVLQS
jgi:hypothetical protein